MGWNASYTTALLLAIMSVFVVDESHALSLQTTTTPAPTTDAQARLQNRLASLQQEASQVTPVTSSSTKPLSYLQQMQLAKGRVPLSKVVDHQPKWNYQGKPIGAEWDKSAYYKGPPQLDWSGKDPASIPVVDHQPKWEQDPTPLSVEWDKGFRG